MCDGTDYRQWMLPKPRAVLILVHGLGACAGRWDPIAGFFLNKGISSYAVECPEPRDYLPGIFRLLHEIKEKLPHKKIFIAGESLGAVYSILAAAEAPKSFSGLVCLSPAFRNRVGLPLSESLNVAAALLYNPKKTFRLPFNSSMCTRDTGYIAKMDADAKESRMASAGCIADTIFSQARAVKTARRLSVPVLFQIAGDDKIVDPGMSVKVFETIEKRDKTLIRYPDMYHSLSIESGKERVFEDMDAWIERRIQG